MPRKIGHFKKTFEGAEFVLGRSGCYWGWANAGRGKGIVNLAEFVWFKTHGPLNDGERLIHIDGDVSNCELKNLSLDGAAPKPAKKAKKQVTKKADK